MTQRLRQLKTNISLMVEQTVGITKEIARTDTYDEQFLNYSKRKLKTIESIHRIL